MPAIRGGKGANSAIAGLRQRPRGSPRKRIAGAAPERELNQRPSPLHPAEAGAKRSERAFAV
jgi:hypothetical protein